MFRHLTARLANPLAMAEKSDAKMAESPTLERGELANDASQMTLAPASEDAIEERAAKRLRMNSSAGPDEGVSAVQTTPGEGPHDAPPKEELKQEEPKLDSRDRRVGMAPIKKE